MSVNLLDRHRPPVFKKTGNVAEHGEDCPTLPAFYLSVL
jgi:hypothetical protein